jgi:hypothetical protein
LYRNITVVPSLFTYSPPFFEPLEVALEFSIVRFHTMDDNPCQKVPHPAKFSSQPDVFLH